MHNRITYIKILSIYKYAVIDSRNNNYYLPKTPEEKH